MWQRYEYIITHANISFRIIACTQFSPQLETFILLLLAPCSPKDGYNKPKTVCMAITAHTVRAVQVVSLFLKDGCDCNNCRLFDHYSLCCSSCTSCLFIPQDNHDRNNCRLFDYYNLCCPSCPSCLLIPQRQP